MNLSRQAIIDLRNELVKIYGRDFSLSDEELNEIGVFMLTSLSEVVKNKKVV